MYLPAPCPIVLQRAQASHFPFPFFRLCQCRVLPASPSVQVMWRYLEQQSFPLTEQEYQLQLDAVAEYLNLWCVFLLFPLPPSEAGIWCPACIAGGIVDSLAGPPRSLQVVQTAWQPAGPPSCLPAVQHLLKLPLFALCRSVQDTVRAGITTANKRGPGYTGGGNARAISIPLGVDVGGTGRADEWNSF